VKDQNNMSLLPLQDYAESLLPSLLMKESAVLGIDIGGTKLAAGVVTSGGAILAYERIATPTHAGAGGLLEAVISLGRRLQNQVHLPVAALGIGCGGPMDYPQGVVSPLHIAAWRRFPLRARLSEAFSLPAVLDNDAKAFALGEALFGAGVNSRALLGMVISTGVGGGVVLNGQLFHGAGGNAGHIGHTVISPRGPRCSCGARGCLTAYASGTGLVARAHTALAGGATSRLADVPETDLTGQLIVAAAQDGDVLGRRLLRDAVMALACGITDAANILDLDRVVLGGGLTGAKEEIFLTPLRAQVKDRTRRLQMSDLDIRLAALGERSGVIGAAGLVLAALEGMRAAK
jgi:glucokinase